MGSTTTHFLSLPPNCLRHFFLNPAKTLPNPNFSPNFRCSSRSLCSDFDAFDTRPFDFDDGFQRRKRRRRRREKRRNWWDEDDDDDDDDDDDGVGFGFWDESSDAVDWLFKILKAFGWMVPTIMVSALLGTGTETNIGSNSLIMAIVLPLGQTALSLVIDKVMGGLSSSPNSRFRPRPRSKSRSRSRRKRNPSYPSGSRNTNGGYQSWAAANNPSAKQSGKISSKYGGWDELDQHVASRNSFTEEQRQKVSALQRENPETDKSSRNINSDKPLFMRLLIAVFPLLGSWTTFLF